MSLRHAVLGLLAELDGASGYDLLKMFEISLGNVWPATQSQVYGELGKLTAEGLIEVVDEGPRGRKEYGITETGRKELTHWLLDVAPKPVRRDDTLLRVFFLGQVEGGQAEELLDRQAGSARKALAGLFELEGRIPWDEDDLSFYGRLTLEYGKRFMAMRSEWLEWARKEIEGHER